MVPPLRYIVACTVLFVVVLSFILVPQLFSKFVELLVMTLLDPAKLVLDYGVLGIYALVFADIYIASSIVTLLGMILGEHFFDKEKIEDVMFLGITSLTVLFIVAVVLSL